MGTRLFRTCAATLAATVLLYAGSASAFRGFGFIRIKLPARPPPPKPVVPPAKPVAAPSFDPQAQLAKEQIDTLAAAVKKAAAEGKAKAEANHGAAKKYEAELAELLK